MNTVERNRRHIIGVAALAGLLLATGTVSAQSVGDCLTADVPAPVVLPDGSTHDAGSLRICLTRVYSPVSGLHETSVDGATAGLLRSRRGTGEDAVVERPYILFQRTARGALRLIGYAWEEDGQMVSYRVAAPAAGGTGLARNDDDGRTRHDEEVERNEAVVLVVARAN